MTATILTIAAAFGVLAFDSRVGDIRQVPAWLRGRILERSILRESQARMRRIRRGRVR